MAELLTILNGKRLKNGRILAIETSRESFSRSRFLQISITSQSESKEINVLKLIDFKNQVGNYRCIQFEIKLCWGATFKKYNYVAILH